MNENFGVGSVLGTSFRVFARNLIPFVLIAGVLNIPTIVWTMSVFNDHFTQLSDSYTWGTRFLGMVINAFITATITFGVVKELQGQRASIGACIANGFKRMLPALGVALVMGLAVCGAFLLLIVPGIIVYCMLYVSVPVSVVEQPGVLDSLRRSRELTTGHKGQVFGILLLIFIMTFGITMMLGGMIKLDTMAHIRTYLYAVLGVQIVLGAFGAVVAAVTYTSLRGDKEGTSANDLASVFE